MGEVCLGGEDTNNDNHLLIKTREFLKTCQLQARWRKSISMRRAHNTAHSVMKIHKESDSKVI